MSVATSGAAVFAQVDESGVGAQSKVRSTQVDDARSPISREVRTGPELVDARDTAAATAPAEETVGLWEQLDRLTPARRANAAIELELSGAASQADHDATVRIADSWNRGDYEHALSRLRQLEEAGASLGLGVAWRVPPAALATDGRIGDTRTEAQTMSLDYDEQSGAVFAVLRWGSTTGGGAWTVNRSPDGGLTWVETYTFSSSTGIIDVDAVVVDDYVYIAYVAGNATDEARIRRCFVSTGGIDTGYSFHVVFDAGANTIEEVALASNANDFDNRIYYAAIQSNDVLRYAFDAAIDGTTFEERSPATSNPEFGLDVTWDNAPGGCSKFLYVSYAGNDGNIHVLGHSDSAWTDWIVESEAGASRRTAVSAYGNTTICAFEYPYTYGTGIRYQISYDCGATWSPGALAVPDGESVYGYFEPDVDARDGDGTAIIYQAEAGAFDPMYYRTRAGFAPGAWSDPIIFSDHDVYTGSETTMAYLPPLAGEQFSHGAMYLSLDPDFRTPYFDRPTASGPSCGDTTPPLVNITAPGTFDCVCDSVDIEGSASDSESTYVRDRLEVRRRDTTAWDVVDTAFGARSGVLYTADTSAWPQDYYYLRVVGENECGLSGSDTTLVYKATRFDNLQLNTPTDGGVYGGQVCFDGTAWTESCFSTYTVDYLPTDGQIWEPVDADYEIYKEPVLNGRLASWNTVALFDGSYKLRVVGETECGHTDEADIAVTVDNTPPTARLDLPEDWDVFVLGDAIEIHGEAADANLDGWTLALIGGPYEDWHTIAGPISSNGAGRLFIWDTTGLPACAYTIRLRASDRAVVDCCVAGHVAEDYLSIVLGGLPSPDLDQDGDVDIVDYLLFELAFTGPLP